MPFSYKTIVFYFFVIPSFIYAGIITQFSFDFFAYDHLWKAYNALAQSMLDGRLDVSYEAIGRESFYYKDKVYFYYGYFPVLLRLLAYPFVDLETISLARISVWLMSVIGAASLQYALLFYSKPKNINYSWSFISKVKLVLLSLIIWFGSAHFIIIQKGMIYHEPFAAMLMLSSLFVVLVYRDIFWDFKTRKYQLVIYALLAAFSIYTRLTIAVSLYLATIILIIMMSIDTLNTKKQQKTFQSFFYEFMKNGYLPILILFLGGALLLLFNYIRFDDLFAMYKGEYGYRRVGEGLSARVCSTFVTGAGQFELARIIPNFIYYFLGGDNIHARIINYLGLGYVRLEFHHIQFIWLWSSLIIFFLVETWQLIKGMIFVRTLKIIFGVSLLGTFTVSSLILLSYTTITVRYMADLWLPIGFAILLFSQSWLFGEKSKIKYLSFIIFVSVIINLVYSTHVYREYRKWDIHDTDPENKLPSKEVLEKLYNPSSIKLNKKEGCKKYNFRVNKKL